MRRVAILPLLLILLLALLSACSSTTNLTPTTSATKTPQPTVSQTAQTTAYVAVSPDGGLTLDCSHLQQSYMLNNASQQTLKWTSRLYYVDNNNDFTQAQVVPSSGTIDPQTQIVVKLQGSAAREFVLSFLSQVTSAHTTGISQEISCKG